MKYFDTIRDRIFYSHDNDSPSADGLVITVECPHCKKFLDIEEPDDNAPTGSKRGEGWCVWCGKRFLFYY